MPQRFELFQNFPNPFNPSTTIRYTLISSGAVSMRVFDCLGREVATLVQKIQAAGDYRVSFDGSRFASGLYLCQLRTGHDITIQKMLLLK